MTQMTKEEKVRRLAILNDIKAAVGTWVNVAEYLDIPVATIWAWIRNLEPEKERSPGSVAKVPHEHTIIYIEAKARDLMVMK